MVACAYELFPLFLLLLATVPAAIIVTPLCSGLARAVAKRCPPARLAAAAAVAGAGLVLCSLQLLHYHSLTSPVSVELTDVSVARLGLSKGPRMGYQLFNPSLARFNGTLVVSVREGKPGNCPGATSFLFGRLYATWDSRALLASIPDAGLLSVSSSPLNVRRDLTDDTDDFLHTGVEDMRLIAGADGKSLYGTLVQGGQLHVTTLAPDLSEVVRVRVWPLARGVWRRDWMHLPFASAPASSPARLAFVRSLSPLSIVAVNPSTGHTTLIFAENRSSASVSGRLVGGTNFLPHPSDENKYFGLVLETEERSTILRVNIERSWTHVVEIERVAGGAWRVSAVSGRVSIPATMEERESGRVQRLHKAMSMVYERRGSTEHVLVGVGHMDCTAHVVRVKTSDLLSTLKRAAAATATAKMAPASAASSAASALGD
eukprot:m51a1_g3934 hypothetical protein (431) ;mRNA; r:238461-240311